MLRSVGDDMQALLFVLWRLSILFWLIVARLAFGVLLLPLVFVARALPPTSLERSVERLFSSLGEALKSVFLEFWLLTIQIVNGFSAAVIHILGQPDNDLLPGSGTPQREKRAGSAGHVGLDHSPARHYSHPHASSAPAKSSNSRRSYSHQKPVRMGSVFSQLVSDSDSESGESVVTTAPLNHTSSLGDDFIPELESVRLEKASPGSFESVRQGILRNWSSSSLSSSFSAAMKEDSGTAFLNTNYDGIHIHHESVGDGDSSVNLRLIRRLVFFPFYLLAYYWSTARRENCVKSDGDSGSPASLHSPMRRRHSRIRTSSLMSPENSSESEGDLEDGSPIGQGSPGLNEAPLRQGDIPEAPEMERIHRHHRNTTGLMEDIQLRCLLLIDVAMDWNKRGTLALVRGLRFVLTAPFERLAQSVTVFEASLAPSRVYSSTSNVLRRIGKEVREASTVIGFRGIVDDSGVGVDTRPAGQVISEAGYEHERLEIKTRDGYILRLDRIPNRTSKHVVYFQHGIFDSSHAFLANGPTSGLAYRAADLGYDVFVGNLRGAGECMHTNPAIRSTDYWNFNMNHHASEDVPAIMQKIIETKRAELPGFNGTITGVAHSMGAAVLQMYVVLSNLYQKEHHLHRVILLSPAGVHRQVPSYFRILGPILRYTVIPLGLFDRGIRIPYSFKILVAKLFEDVKRFPATRDLMTMVMSSFLLGGASLASPLKHVHNLPYTLTATSAGVMKHLYQIWRTDRFACYDYGREKNMQLYGEVSPPSILENFSRVDIPFFYVTGSEDRLIPAENVLVQYRALKAVSPSLAHYKTFPNLGHIEFVYGMNDRVISYVMLLLACRSSLVAVSEPTLRHLPKKGGYRLLVNEDLRGIQDRSLPSWNGDGAGEESSGPLRFATPPRHKRKPKEESKAGPHRRLHRRLSSASSMVL